MLVLLLLGGVSLLSGARRRRMVGGVLQVLSPALILAQARRIVMLPSQPMSKVRSALTSPTSRDLLSRRDELKREVGVDEDVTALIRRYQSHCRRVAFNIVRDPDAAEDVVQEAFVRVWLAYKRYSPEQRESLRVPSWLSRIVKNEALKYLASRQKLEQLDSEDGLWEDELEGPAQEQPEVAVEEEEEKKSLGRLLRLLPSRSMYRHTIEMWLDFGGSYEDLAEAFGCDIRTVRTRYHRATQRLQAIIRKQHIRESDLRGWLHAYRLVLEEWSLDRRPWRFSLRDFIKGEAYANTFGGHPYRGQQMVGVADEWVPDEWLPPSYWN